jgi:polysaccharide biosynthesis protein PslG
MSKTPIFLVVPALLALIALSLVGCSHARTPEAAGPIPCAHHGAAFAKPCLPAAPAKAIGIAEPDLIAKSAAVQASQLAQMKAIGITSIRLDADWSQTQPTGVGTFAWIPLDRVVKSVLAAGMTLDLIIDGCPAWAAAAGTANDPSPVPKSPAQYGTFAAQVAARYGPQGVKLFEIWNEPNNAQFWANKANAAAYTALLKAAYPAIKKVDPAAFVLSGGLAPESNDGTDIAPVTYLQQMYAAGAQGNFDGLGYHPYSYPALPNSVEPWSGWSQMNQTTPSIRSVMAANGDTAKQIWITEVGAPSSGPDGVGQAGEANDLTQAITDAKSSTWIGALYLYSWQDEGTDTTNDQDWFGLVTAGGGHKSAYNAVAAAIG